VLLVTDLESDEMLAGIRQLGIKVWTASEVQARLFSGSPVARLLIRLQIQKLSLLQFGRFSNLNLIFPSTGPIALVGINGSGKSTLLGAIAIAFSWMIARIRDERGRGDMIVDANIHNASSATKIMVEVANGEALFQWTLAATREGAPRTTESELAGLRTLTAGYQQSLEADPMASLPLVAHYPVRRALSGIPKRVAASVQGLNQLRGYDGALWSDSNNSFRGFFAWFREGEDKENDMKLS
jgi:predicted ATP-binding protein involved in virulence